MINVWHWTSKLELRTEWSIPNVGHNDLLFTMTYFSLKILFQAIFHIILFHVYWINRIAYFHQRKHDFHHKAFINIQSNKIKQNLLLSKIGIVLNSSSMQKIKLICFLLIGWFAGIVRVVADNSDTVRGVWILCDVSAPFWPSIAGWLCAVAVPTLLLCEMLEKIPHHKTTTGLWHHTLPGNRSHLTKFNCK